MSLMSHSLATPESRIRAVIFDCDGVLADTEDAWLLVEREVCQAYGVDPFHADRTDTRGVSMHESVRLLLPHITDADELLAAAELLIATATRLVAAQAKPLPGVAALVPALATLRPIAVASNSPACVLDPVLRGIGIRDHFQHAIGADQVASPKPAPDLYLFAAQSVGCAPEQVLVIEDSATGVQAARAAGCVTVQVLVTGVQRVEQAQAWLPDLRIDPQSLLDLGVAASLT